MTTSRTKELAFEDAKARLVAVRQLRLAGDLRITDQVLRAAEQDVELARVALDASARVAAIPEQSSGMASIGRSLPQYATEIVAGGFRRLLPKLWASETSRFDASRKFNLDTWRNAFRGAVGNTHYGFHIIEVLFKRARTSRDRSVAAVITMEDISKTVGCCVDTVRRFVRRGEVLGFLDTWNRTARRTSGKLKGFVLREANAYVPIMPEDDLADAAAAAPDSAEAVVAGDGVSFQQAWLGRIARQLKRGELYFRGLFGRKIGLNLSPPRTRPAPA